MTERLVQWDSIDLRISGRRIAEMAGAEVERMRAPVADLALQFDRDLLRIDGRIRKGILIPFNIEIRRIDAAGKRVQIFLDRAAAFGIPLPVFLLGLVRERLAALEIEYDAVTRSFLVRLDRFLPSFVDVNLAAISIVEGGIAVRLGTGGADPPSSGGINGSGNS